MTVAALYVRRDGPYAGRPDVDVWDEVRDARKYAGPWPVVAHPPCARWGAMAHFGGRIGDDNGCFEAALRCVRAYGGVIEHPAGSKAWFQFGLPIPSFGEPWRGSLFDVGVSVAVEQHAYGHRCRKPTWLYYVGAPAPALPDLTRAAPGSVRVWLRSGPRGYSSEHRRNLGITLLPKRERELTPPRFADYLVALARGAS